MLQCIFCKSLKETLYLYKKINLVNFKSYKFYFIVKESLFLNKICLKRLNYQENQYHVFHNNILTAIKISIFYFKIKK